MAACSLPYFAITAMAPFERTIRADDVTLMFPHRTSETVPMWALVSLSSVVPLVGILATFLATRSSWAQPGAAAPDAVDQADGRNDRDLERALMALMLALVLVVEVTNILKYSLGFPRPDFLARCRPDPDGPIAGVVCQGGDARAIREGRLSFPSGHTSTTFAGMAVLSLVIVQRARLGRRERGATLIVALALAPLIVAALVGISRINDYRHHTRDVAFSVPLGILCATIAYLTFFPRPPNSNGEPPRRRHALDPPADDDRTASFSASQKTEWRAGDDARMQRGEEDPFALRDLDP